MTLIIKFKGKRMQFNEEPFLFQSRTKKYKLKE